MRPVVICHQTDVVGYGIAFVFTWEKFSRFIHISSDKKNDSNVSDVGSKFLLWSFMCLMDILLI